MSRRNGGGHQKIRIGTGAGDSRDGADSGLWFQNANLYRWVSDEIRRKGEGLLSLPTLQLLNCINGTFHQYPFSGGAIVARETKDCYTCRQIVYRGVGLLIGLLLVSLLGAAARATQLSPFPLGDADSSGAEQNSQDVRTLEPGQPIEREIGSSETHFYQITLTSDQFLHVVTEQLSINLSVTLFGPDGRRLTDFSDWVELPGRVWWIAE